MKLGFYFRVNWQRPASTPTSPLLSHTHKYSPRAMETVMGQLQTPMPIVGCLSTSLAKERWLFLLAAFHILEDPSHLQNSEHSECSDCKVVLEK